MESQLSKSLAFAWFLISTSLTRTHAQGQTVGRALLLGCSFQLQEDRQARFLVWISSVRLQTSKLIVATDAPQPPFDVCLWYRVQTGNSYKPHEPWPDWRYTPGLLAFELLFGLIHWECGCGSLFLSRRTFRWLSRFETAQLFGRGSHPCFRDARPKF